MQIKVKKAVADDFFEEIAVISGLQFSIGKDQSSHVIVNDESIGKNHLKIIFEDNRLYLIDQGITSGSYLEDFVLKPFFRTPYKSDQIISLGSNVKIKLETLGENLKKLPRIKGNLEEILAFEQDVVVERVKRTEAHLKQSVLGEQKETKNFYMSLFIAFSLLIFLFMFLKDLSTENEERAETTIIHKNLVKTLHIELKDVTDELKKIVPEISDDNERSIASVPESHFEKNDIELFDDQSFVESKKQELEDLGFPKEKIESFFIKFKEFGAEYKSLSDELQNAPDDISRKEIENTMNFKREELESYRLLILGNTP